MSARVTVRLPPEVLDRLCALAAQQGHPLSALIRRRLGHVAESPAVQAPAMGSASTRQGR
jgi:predicted DNA-binding protein